MELVKTVSKVCLMITVICLLWVITANLVDIMPKNEAEKHISQGTVVQHEYISEYTTIFKYVPPRYRLHIKGEYEYDGETFVGNTYYDVSEEVYNYFEDGDWFNSATFLKEVAEQSEQEQ